MSANTLQPAPVQADDRLLRPCEVAAVLNVSVRTIWRMLERGEIPEPIRYNRKIVRFTHSSITAHIKAMSHEG
jgi:excisionase family DNA binding protein